MLITIVMRLLFFFKKALRDMNTNRFLYGITVGTIGLVLLILATFIIIFANVNHLVDAWQEDISIVAYVEEGVKPERIDRLQQYIKGLYGVNKVTFVPPDKALRRLKVQMQHQRGILDGLQENPLPPSFEISLNPSFYDQKLIEGLVEQIRKTEDIADVQYGQAWVNRFLVFLNLLKIVGFVLSVLLLLIAIFIISNTIKLMLYAKREELEIMQLVGATAYFIKMPFYIQGLFQGLLGGLVSLGILYLLFSVFISKTNMTGLALTYFHVSFLSKDLMTMVIVLGMFAGWLGSYLSLKKFLKD
jgi:cell division transport system permease protein